ncbi:hypothetical protein [Sedimentisphaera salicampi]|uniref:Uncharacterized protein n=1 Tax=Sedimentisphaera salicampi TaxID=1941349 RepID=A0A1W6LIS8_9BACT|nr:hypothetical protein [Sedimentisphaera salicampi]ARN55643.1 hypothetical protein STSP1_00003 [Sedimentisphaera salicampi]OXU16162.1 hypothetical protein SMSP1_00003 [Sedimentisphaera salicampi]
MNNYKDEYTAAGIEFLTLAGISMIAPLCVYLDITVLDRRLSEVSATEIMQLVILFICGLACTRNAFRFANCRGMYTLIAGFFFCMLIREMDAFFDQISHGFWVWPALAAAGFSIWLSAAKYRDSLLLPFREFLKSKAFVHMAYGMVIVLFFSRVFGSGRLIWNSISGSIDSSLYKGVIQEGLELLGYVFILNAVLKLYGYCRDFNLKSRSCED